MAGRPSCWALAYILVSYDTYSTLNIVLFSSWSLTSVRVYYLWVLLARVYLFWPCHIALNFVFSERRYMLSPVRLLSVCLRLSVTLVRRTQPVEIFVHISTPFGTLAIRWHSQKILRRSSQENPSVGSLNARGLAKYSAFLPIEGSISARQEVSYY